MGKANADFTLILTRVAVPPPQTFQPVITNKGFKHRPSASVHDRLTAYGVKAEEKRDEAHKKGLEVMREEEKKRNTFQPNVTAKGRKAMQPDKVEDRLFRLAGERDVVRECTKYHMMEAEVQRYPFKPEINSNANAKVSAKGKDYKPIYMRTGEVIQQKQEKLNVLRER